MTTEEEDYTPEVSEDLDAPKNSLMGHFIDIRAIREIVDKKDFRIPSDIRQINGKYRVGKQTNTTFYIRGIDDHYNQSNVKNSFEQYLLTNTSWNMFQALRSFSGRKIYDEVQLKVYIQDTFDIIRDLMEPSLDLFIQSDPHIPASIRPYKEHLITFRALSIYDRFVYFIQYCYEYLVVSSNQDVYHYLEYLFEPTKVPLKWFIEKLELNTFSDVGELHHHYRSLVPVNRREHVEYTLQYHEDHLYDTHNLDKIIIKFLTTEQLVITENLQRIASVIKSEASKKEVIFKILLKRSIPYDPLHLKAFGIPVGLTLDEEVEYELQFHNFIVGTNVSQTFKYRRVKEGCYHKTLEADTFVQFSEAKLLLNLTDLTEEQKYEFIELICNGTMTYMNYKISGIICNAKHIGKQKRTTITQLVPNSDGEALFESIEFSPRQQPSPRHLIGRRLSVLNVPFKTNINEYERESLGGLYTHQIAFINNTLDMLFHYLYIAVIYNTVVSSGKTTSVVSLAYALSYIGGTNGKKMTLIYTTWSPNVLKEIFIKSKEIGLKVLSAFNNANGHMVIKSASSFQNKNNIPFREITNHDILVCHPLILMKLLSSNNERCDTSNIVVVIDELNSGKTNSMSEHVLGSLISYLTEKSIHMCLLSASIQRNKHINYLTNYGKIKLVESSNILVPTVVRMFNGTPMNIFNWMTAPTQRTKVLENSFFRRFVNPENVVLPPQYVEMMKRQGVFDYSIMLEVFFLYGNNQQITGFINSGSARPNDTPETISDAEMKCIKQSNNYTLVATSNPGLLAIELYGDILPIVRTILEEKVTNIQVLYSELQAIEATLKKPCYNDNPVKASLLRKNALIDERKRRESELRTDDEGHVVNMTTNGILRAMSNDILRFTVEERRLISTLMTCDDVEDKVIDKLLAKPGLTLKEKEVLETLSGQTLTKSERRNLQTLAEEQKLIADRASLKRQEEYVSNEIRDLIMRVLQTRQIVHKFKPVVDLADIIAWNKNKTEDYIYKLLGVFVETKKTPIAPQYQLNRLIAGENFSRGIDLAIEAVIVTNDFANNYSSDTILQMSGRCGRPGKSKISIVYMSSDTYDRIYKSGSSSDINKIILRSNYYLQNQSQTDVWEMPREEQNFVQRIELLAENLRK